MQKLYYAKTQMNGGLVSPIIEGRPDFEATGKSCRQELNMISTVYGSAFNRGGTIYVGTNKTTSEKFILVPFTVGERVSYVLEFGDRYIRVYRYHGQIQVEDVAYEIETSYDLADFFDANGRVLFDFKQSADVLYMVHEKYPPNKLIRYSDTNWQIAPIVFNNGPWQKMNTDASYKLKATGSTGIVTLSTEVGTAPTTPNITCTSAISGAISMHRVYVRYGGTDGDDTLIGYTEGSGWPTGSWAETAAEVINRNSSDLIATNPTRTTVKVTARANYATYSGQKIDVEVWAADAYGVDWHIKHNRGTFSDTSTVVSLFDESWVGRKIRLHQVDTVVQGWRSGWTVAIDTLCRAGENYYKATSAGTTGPQQPTHVEGIENDGGVTWQYLHSGYGWGEIVEYISATEVKLKVESFIPQGVIDTGTYEWELSLIDSSTGVWPCAVEFFQDRLTFGTNLPLGPTISFSVTGDYENFADMENGEQLADSAFNLTLFTDLNKITWLCTQKNLYIGTEGSLVMSYALSNSEPFGPNNVTYDELSTIGTCNVKPIKIGGDILFLGPKGTDIYIVEYDYVTDSYDPKEVSILSRAHLEQGIIAWTLQLVPNKMIYAIRSDKKIVGLVYNKEQQIRAFNIIETAGDFETICTIPNAEEAIDEVWVGVKRHINGADTRYIEYFSNGLPTNVPAANSSSIESILEYMLNKSIYLDSAKTYTFSEDATEITGLSHLEGEEVMVVADNIDKKYLVTNGTITLSTGAKKVKVGIPYTSILEPMPISQELQNGSGICRTQRISSIIARIYRTHSFKYGPSLENLKEAKVNTVYDNIDEEVLKSGDIKLDWHGDVTDQILQNNEIVDSTGARMLFVQDRPFPVHIVALSVAINISEDIR